MWFQNVFVAAVALPAAVIAIAGCSDQAKPVRRYTLTHAPGPLDEVRVLLERYAEGQPVGSEVLNFETLVGRVRESDADKAAMIEEGLAAIAKSPATAAARAKSLLKTLEPTPPGK